MRDLCVGEKENCPNLECSTRPQAEKYDPRLGTPPGSRSRTTEPTGVLVHLPWKDHCVGVLQTIPHSVVKEQRALMFKSPSLPSPWWHFSNWPSRRLCKLLRILLKSRDPDAHHRKGPEAEMEMLSCSLHLVPWLSESEPIPSPLLGFSSVNWRC